MGSHVEETNYDELAQMLDYFFAKTLAPTVIVSKNESLIKHIISAVSTPLNEVQSITNVDPEKMKMMKCLYDPADTENLRDDILKLGGGKGTFVSVEFKCYTQDAQLCTREILEDSPSMTAFSSSKSALYKEGLFFGVYVQGDITPEVLSRASLVL